MTATGKPTGEHSGNLPDSSGTYALLLALPQSVQLRIGALGECRFDTGWYVYLGSALGPGGLAARVGRHIGAQGRRHWHIDHLTRVADVVRVGWLMDGQRRECSWAQAVGGWPGARLALARFGASDCRCNAHLWAFYEQPDLARLPGGGTIALLDLAEPPS
ncbi:MAG: GIY-YIG nuclease family protein [Anaerolineales bacterium]|nr:GIY-YIG nuclease family protein [Anaerolineales bacterium]